MNGVVKDFTQGLLEVFVDEFGVEEHFGAEESLVAHIQLDHVPIQRLVHKLLKLGRLDHFICGGVRRFRIKLAKLFEHILAHVPILFLDFACNFERIFGLEFLTTIFQLAQGEIGDVSAG